MFAKTVCLLKQGIFFFVLGQLECGDAKAIKALKTKAKPLPKKLHCTLEECRFPNGHVNAGHGCGECGGFGHSAVLCADKAKGKTTKNGKKNKTADKEEDDEKDTKNKKAKTTKTSSKTNKKEEKEEKEERFYNTAARNREFKGMVLEERE